MRTTLLTSAILALSLPSLAYADSYALLDLNDQPTCSNRFFCDGDHATVTLPQATLQYGYVQSHGAYNSYTIQGEATTDGTPENRAMRILFSPDFPVSEMRFNLSSSGNGASDIVVFGFDAHGNTITDADFPCDTYPVACDDVVDIKFPTDPYGIYVYDGGNDFSWYFEIDHIELNPSLAPSAVTPEPSSMVLAGTGPMTLLAFAAFRRVRARFA